VGAQGGAVMTVFIIREGRLIEKGEEVLERVPASFPAPMVSRMISFDSPVTGKTISSWRERDRDLYASGSVDPRDIPKHLIENRREFNARSRATEQ
jgi:hypothetical protein